MEMQQAVCFLSLAIGAFAIDQQGHPFAYAKIDPTLVDFQNSTNVYRLHNPGLNENQFAILSPNGRITAFQYFLKKHEHEIMTYDLERYLELLAYAHEKLEWGPQGPPGGFSIKNLPKYTLPLVKNRREVGFRNSTSEELDHLVTKTKPWVDKLHALMAKFKLLDDLPEPHRNSSINEMSRALSDLYVRDVRSIGDTLNQLIVEVKRIFGMEQQNEQARQKRAEQLTMNHGEVVTLFNAEADRKYRRFLENYWRKKEQIKKGEQEKEKENRRMEHKRLDNFVFRDWEVMQESETKWEDPAEGLSEKKKDSKPYVVAIGHYILVPKNTDIDWLQNELRKTSSEQRYRQNTIDKLRKVADRARTF